MKRIVLLLAIVVAAGVFALPALSRQLGAWILDRVVDRAKSDYGVAVTARNARWLGTTVVFEDVVIRHRFANATLEMGARTARVAFNPGDWLGSRPLGDVRLDSPVIDLVSTSAADAGFVFDAGILQDVNSGYLTITGENGGLRVHAEQVNFRTRTRGGDVTFWFHDTHFNVFLPQGAVLDGGSGDFGFGVVQSDWVRLAGAHGAVKIDTKGLQVDPFTVNVTERTEIVGRLSVSSVLSEFTYRFDASAQPIDVFDLLDATIWHGQHPGDFSYISTGVLRTREPFAIGFRLAFSGSNLESIVGKGALILRPGEVPRLPLTDDLAQLLGVAHPGASFGGGTIEFDLSTNAVTLQPSLLKSSTTEATVPALVELCVGGSLQLKSPQPVAVWLLARIDQRLLKFVRASKETLALLHVDGNAVLIPLAFEGTKPRMAVTADDLEWLASGRSQSRVPDGPPRAACWPASRS
jgi:hypothetical protein